MPPPSLRPYLVSLPGLKVSLIASGGFALIFVVSIETGELRGGDTFPEGGRAGGREGGREGGKERGVEKWVALSSMDIRIKIN